MACLLIGLGEALHGLAHASLYLVSGLLLGRNPHAEVIARSCLSPVEWVENAPIIRICWFELVSIFQIATDGLTYTLSSASNSILVREGCFLKISLRVIHRVAR
jgi:hypothetical protein